ncbi:MAG: hypothetical protein AAF939_16550 [Planctomycetota bacterium]
MNPMLKVDVLRAACCVAGIEGNVGEAEKAVLERLADEVGVGEASLQAMINRAQTDPDFHKEQFRVLKAEPKETMAILLEVAIADKKFTASECDVLRALSKKLDVSDEIFDQLVERVRQLGE